MIKKEGCWKKNLKHIRYNYTRKTTKIQRINKEKNNRFETERNNIPVKKMEQTHKLNRSRNPMKRRQNEENK